MILGVFQDLSDSVLLLLSPDHIHKTKFYIYMSEFLSLVRKGVHVLATLDKVAPIELKFLYVILLRYLGAESTLVWSPTSWLFIATPSKSTPLGHFLALKWSGR